VFFRLLITIIAGIYQHYMKHVPQDARTLTLLNCTRAIAAANSLDGFDRWSLGHINLGNFDRKLRACCFLGMDETYLIRIFLD
jgi:hypothetical protein